MKKEIYMSVEILTFGDGREHIRFLQQIDDGELESIPISHEKACKLMWELVLAGGKRDVSVNMFDPSIVFSGAYIFLPN